MIGLVATVETNKRPVRFCAIEAQRTHEIASACAMQERK